MLFRSPGDPLDDRGIARELLRPAAGHPVSYLGQASVAGDGANYPIAWLVVPGGAALTGATGQASTLKRLPTPE